MSRRFQFVETPLEGLYLIDRKLNEDHRGFLSRMYCADEFKESGVSLPVVQMNHTMTRRKGALRGMHFQYPPYAETKFISCIKGEVLDVAIDIRAGSPTFLSWHAETLSADNHISIYIPNGFAHGFQALTDNCELIYAHSKPYMPNSEGALNALDPLVSIDWPLEVSEISERDQSHPMLDNSFKGIDVL